MANRETSKTFLQRLKSIFSDRNTPESHRRESGLSSQSRILDIEIAERADRAELTERAERLCASKKALNDAVLERLGFSNQMLIEGTERLCASQKALNNEVLERLELSNQMLNEHTKRLLASQKALNKELLDKLGLSNQTLNERTERLLASQKSLNNKILERLGLSNQHDTLPSPQPPASPRRNPESSLQGRRIRQVSKLPLIVEMNSSRTTSTDQTLDEDDPFFERKLRLGSEMAILACKLSKMKARSPSPVTSISPVDSLSSVDTHTPSELRAMSQIRSPVSSPFTPTPPPTAAPLTGRASRRLVMSANLRGACKEVADGSKLQSPNTKVEEFVQQVYVPSPRPPAAPRKTKGRTPVVPAALKKAARPKKGEPRRGTNLRPRKADKGACHDELQPLAMPAESLSLCFKQLDSDDWMKKMEGLKTIQALARHHPQLLQTKLHEICIVLKEEVNNLRSNVACAAMKSVAELHLRLGKAMDPEAEWTGRTLLLKLAQTTSAFIHQEANLALDALVEGCTPARVMTTLLNTGLSHRCAAVRESTAQHLHQLAEIVGEDHILTAGKIFAGSFLSAVCKMSMDAAPEVRHHGQKMLQGLVFQREFNSMFNKLIPENDRRPLAKILTKMRQQKQRT